MKRYELVRQALEKNPNLVVGGVETVERAYLRSHPGCRYLQTHIMVWPKERLPNITELEGFFRKEVLLPIPILPLNVAKCYSYRSMSKPFAKLGAAYYVEELPNAAKDGLLEEWVIVSVAPCEQIGKTNRIRETVQLKTVPCSLPCDKSRDCAFKQGKRVGLPL